MTVGLLDNETEEFFFDVNFWHYRTLVETIRALAVLSDDCIDRLHEPFTGAGLTKDESRMVAEKLRSRVLPRLQEDDRLLLDGSTTKATDDGAFHRSEDDCTKNYSTNRQVLVEFIQALEACNGFTVS